MSNRALARYGGDCSHNDRQTTSRHRQPSLSLARWGGGGRDGHHSSSYQDEARASWPLFSRSSRHTSTRVRYDNSSGDEHYRPRRAGARRSTREPAHSSEEDCSRLRRGIPATLRHAFQPRGTRSLRRHPRTWRRRQTPAKGPQRTVFVLQRRHPRPQNLVPRRHTPSLAAQPCCNVELRRRRFRQRPRRLLELPWRRHRRHHHQTQLRRTALRQRQLHTQQHLRLPIKQRPRPSQPPHAGACASTEHQPPHHQSQEPRACPTIAEPRRSRSFASGGREGSGSDSATEGGAAGDAERRGGGGGVCGGEEGEIFGWFVSTAEPLWVCGGLLHNFSSMAVEHIM